MLLTSFLFDYVLFIVTDLKTGTSFTETYDKLILSPGAKPVLPDFYAENERVFTLRTVEDTLKIRDSRAAPT